MIKKVELIVEKNSIDLFGDESFPLSFSIDEINDIGKKAASYSKEINIPATQLNNQIFTSLFDVTVEGGFNPISRKYATLLVDGVPVMRGYFKLLGVNIKNNEYVTYRGLLYEEQINFIQALDQYELTNLNMVATGTTTSMTGPYTYLSQFKILNSPNIFTSSVGKTNTGGTWTSALNYNNLQWTGSTYGFISQQNRLVGNSTANGVTVTMPTNYSWNPTSMNAYEASSAQYLEFRANVKLRIFASIAGGTTYTPIFAWRIVKSDYTSPISGLYSDTVLANGYLTGSSISNSGIFPILTSTSTLDTGTIGVQLGSGDKVRFECWLSNPGPTNSFSINDGSEITGKVYSGPTTTVTGETFNLTRVLQNINNVNTSDDATIVFPLIDYSKLYNFFTINTSLINWSNQPSFLPISAEDLRPMVFVKRVWDSIFKQAGFKYKSNFLNSDTFKKMVIGGGIEETEISSTMLSTIVNPHRTNYDVLLHTLKDNENISSGVLTRYDYREFHMGNAFATATTGTTAWFVTESNVDAYQTYAPANRFYHNNAYLTPGTNGTVTSGGATTYYGYGNLAVTADTPYGYFPTAPRDGRYRIKAKITFTSYAPFQISSPATLINFQTRYSLQVQKMVVGSYKHISTFTTPSYNNWKVEKSKTVIRATGTTNQNLSIELDEIIDLKKGDMLRIAFYGDANSQANFSTSVWGSRVTIDPTPANTYMEFGRFGTILNSKIDNYATLLPRGIKQRDFILEIAKMFNLYFETDREDNRTMLIEPRDTYYEAGVIRDYSKKIDYSKDLQIDILSHDFPKTTTFQYKEDDKDYYGKIYEQFAGNQKPFGSYVYVSPNEYTVEDSELQLKFASSYIQKIGDTGIKITKIIDPAKMEPDGSSKTSPYKIQPRVMMYKKKTITPGVTIPSNYYPSLSIATNSVPYTPYTVSATSGFNTAGGYALTAYGYAGHLNDPDTPTFDLNWFTDFNYLPGTTGTTQNLINVFYKQQLIELTDPSARKITCFVDLQPVDIHNLRFCDVYYFNKEYWRLLNISDYDTSSDVAQTTKCEFIKIVRAQTNALIDYAAFGYLGINGGSGGGITGGIFGSTDPVTGNPLLMLNSGTTPVTELTPQTYFDVVAELNTINVDVATRAGGLGPLTEMAPNTRFEDVAQESALNTNRISQLTELVYNPPTGDIYYITGDADVESEIGIPEGYKTVLFDGVNNRTNIYNIALPTVVTDGYNIKFDISNDGDFAMVNFTTSNIMGEDLYVVNYENKLDATYILERDIWTIKRF
jgi:hypothetical protein